MILVVLGTYVIYSDLHKKVKSSESIILPVILLVIVAAVVYFVLPYVF